jgi:hypothetical protein
MYYVVNPTTNTFQLSLTSSGSPVVPSNQGYGAEWISPTIPLGTAEIILRSSAADSALPPPNVRLDPVAYASSLAVLQSTCANNSATCYYSTVQMQPFVHHIRIGPGVEITSTPYFVSQTNQFDSANQRYLWSQGNLQTWSNIVFDRMWLHGQPCPDRTIFGIQADGSNIEIDSSVIDNISVCRPNYNGLAVTDTSSSLSIASGTYYFLTSTQTVASGIGATVSGTASGTVYVTLPTGSATPKVYAPSGTTVVCTGCTGVASTLAGFPVDANGRYTEGPIASIPITSGVLGSPVQAIDLSNIVFVWDASQLSAVGGCTIGCTEGGLGIDVVIGPGPMRVTNTYFYNDIGIAYFIEDTGAAQGYSLADYLTYRNTFQIDPVWSPSNTATNHLNACNRNIFEEKTGQRMAVIGNTFTGNYSYCTPGGYAVILAANNAASSVSVPPVAQMADLTAAYNTIMNSSGGIEVTDIQGTPAPHVPRRVLLHDNVISVNGYQHMSSAPSSFYNAYGVGLYLGIGGEDWTVNHNTLYNVGGYQPAAILWEWSKQEGVNITNNLFIDIGQDATKNIISSDGLTTQGLNHAIPSCYGLTGKLAMDCSFTPSYNFLGNVLSVGYTNTQAGTGEPIDPTMGGAYTGTDASNTVRVESTVALRNAAIGFQSVSAGNYRFSRLSPYLGNTHPATDSTPIGVNQDALDQAQGTIYNLRPLLVTSSGATLYMTVPDAGASCWIRYGTGADLTVYAQTDVDTTASRYRAISVTGLSPSTQYTFYGECAKASNTPSVTFSTL